MPHVVLLGDSIFDNASYVPGHPDVIAQLREVLPSDWQATLRARDGATTHDIARQLAGLPRDATHLVASAGGNDALGHQAMLGQPTSMVLEALARLSEVQDSFRHSYRAMLDALLRPGLPLLLCTIYDAIPELGREGRTALSLFNDIIVREAVARSLPVIDLRLVCPEASDYSSISPIEPSHTGGAKIARAILRALERTGGRAGECVILD